MTFDIESQSTSTAKRRSDSRMIGVRGGKDLAQPLRVASAERVALLVAEGRRDAVEGVELAEQQSREPALLPLAQKLLDEPDARVRLLAEPVFFLCLGHGESHEHPARDWSGNLQQNAATCGCERDHDGAGSVAASRDAASTSDGLTSAGVDITEAARAARRGAGAAGTALAIASAKPSGNGERGAAMARVKPSIRPTETYTEPNFLRVYTARAARAARPAARDDRAPLLHRRGRRQAVGLELHDDRGWRSDVEGRRDVHRPQLRGRARHPGHLRVPRDLIARRLARARY